MKSSQKSKNATSLSEDHENIASMENLHVSSIPHLGNAAHDTSEDAIETHDESMESHTEQGRNAMSQQFDKTFLKVIDLIDCEDEVVQCCTKYQSFIRKYIGILKEMTHRVTDLQLCPTKQQDGQDKEESNMQRQDEATIERTNHNHFTTTTNQPQHWRNPTSYYRKSVDISKPADMSKSTAISETSDDAEHPKYLLIPALLGFLHLKIKDYDRLKLLQLACIYFRDFLERCKAHNVMESTWEALEDDLFQLKDENEFVHYKEKKDIRRSHMRELNAILRHVRGNCLRAQSCNECHTPDDTMSEEVSTPGVESFLHDPCLPGSLDIPGPESATSFHQFVLYKYGRDYMNAKSVLEIRDRERKRSEEKIQSESHIESMFSIQQDFRDQIGQNLKAILEEKRKSWQGHTCCLNERNFSGGRELEGKSCDTYTSSATTTCPLTQITFNKHFLWLFAHKCQTQLEICLIEIRIQRSLRAGSLFRPCYLEHLWEITRSDQEERSYEPVLMK